MCLPLASKALAPLLWLLASESKDGSFDGSLDELVFRLHITPKDYQDGVKPLIDKGFFVVASGVLAESYQVAIPEREGETETETKTETKKEKKSAVAPRPEDVSQQVWDDWVALRKRKGTTISQTAIDGAREDAAKIGWTLQQFLIEWCTRGSQGLKAEWIKSADKQNQTETVYQRSMRLKMQEAVPTIAKQAPYQDASDFFRTIDMPAKKAIEVNK